MRWIAAVTFSAVLLAASAWFGARDAPESRASAASTPASNVDVLVAPEAARSKPIESHEADRESVAIGGGSTLRGRLVDQHGDPIAQRLMWLTPHGTAGSPQSGSCYFTAGDSDHVVGTATTDDAGLFEFADVPKGKWWLGPGATRKDTESTQVDDVASVATIVESSEDASQVVELSVDRGLFIRGKVVDSAGHPIPHAVLTASSSSLRGIASTQQSDDKGEFALGPLAATPHIVQASAVEGHADAPPITATPNGSEIIVHLEVGGRITGRAIDPATGRGVRARISVTPSGSPGSMGCNTDEDGAFVIDGLASGTYDVTATTDDAHVGTTKGVVVVGGQETSSVEIHVESGAQVTVRYKGGVDHASVSVFSGTTIVETDDIASGAQRTFKVPAGHIRIELSGKGDLKEIREVDVVPGETKEVEFEIP